MNKKAETGDQIMFFPFIFIMLVIAAGIVTGVLLFYGEKYDARANDAYTLNYHIKNCLSNNDLNSIKIDFYIACNIHKDSLAGHKIGFKICENKEAEECIVSTTPLASSGSNFEACLFTGAKNNKNYPSCSYDTLNVKDNRYFIVTSSNQESWRQAE